MGEYTNYFILFGVTTGSMIFLYSWLTIYRYYCKRQNNQLEVNEYTNNTNNINNEPYIIIHQNPIPPPYKEVDDDIISLPPAYNE